MSEVVVIDNGNYTEDLIKKISNCIFEKKILIMPSDTIYGFLCLPELEEKLRTIKKRETKPFIHLVKSISDLSYFKIEVNEYQSVLEKNWPGPMTFILKGKSEKTYGLRMPDSEFLLDILKKVESPLLSTSVNYSGMPALTNFEEIKKDFFDKVEMMVYDKSYRGDVSSTIVDLTSKPYNILRTGKKIFIE
jgi:L-threonylcarbamoyladenylate synthase